VTAPKESVSAPSTIKNEFVKSVNSKRTENRIIKNTPATTRVDEWISAEAGVGASIASGNQTCAKNCAALIPPESTNVIEKNVRKCQAELPINKKWNAINGTCKNITERSVELKTVIVNKNEVNINISLTRDQIKVFCAALMV
jgi:hypothetical protein